MINHSGNNERQLRRCPICRTSYTDQMVTCHRCNRRIHNACAGVTGIIGSDWVCPNCTYRDGTGTTNAANTVSGNNINTRTQPLNAVVTENQPQAAYNQMQQLLDQNILELSHNLGQNRLSNINSVRSASNQALNSDQPAPATSHGQQQRATSPVAPNVGHEPNQQQQPTNPGIQNMSNRDQLQALLRTNMMEQENLRRERELIIQQRTILEQLLVLDELPEELPPYNNQNYNANSAAQPPFATGTTPSLLQNVHRPQPVHSTPYQPTTRQPGAYRNLATGAEARNYRENVSYNTHLTPEQLSARQTLGKDLLTFNGDPTEWPAFISSYRESTSACGFTDNENLIRLKRALKGPALRMVSSLLTRPENIPMVLERLKRFFGKPELVLQELINRVKSLPPPKPGKLDSIMSYAIEVENLGITLEDEDLEDHRRNPTLLRELIMKLPYDLQMSWAEHVRSHDVRNDIVEFSIWLYDKATSLYEVLPYLASQPDSKPQKKYVNYHDTNETFDTSDDNDDDEYAEAAGEDVANDVNPVNYHGVSPAKICCHFCKGSCNDVAKCRKFLEATLSQRWDFVKNLDACRKCLDLHSFNRPCPKPVRCTYSGCERRHHPLLHNEKRQTGIETPIPRVDIEGNFSHTTREHQSLFRYVPITLQHGEKSIKTFAFLDEGSSTTLLNQKVANELGLAGKKRPLCLSWTDEKLCRNENDSQEVTMKISIDENPKNQFHIKARTISSLSLPSQSLNYDVMQNDYPYLKNLPVSSYQNAIPDLLVGIDNWHLAVPLKIIEGAAMTDPIALKCRLGWTVVNSTKTTTINHVNLHYTCCDHTKHTNEDLSELIKSFYATDFLGIRQQSQALMSNDEKRALELLETTTKRVDERFEVGLLWKYKNFQLPESRNMALKRLRCLEASLKKKPELTTEIEKQIEDYEQKRYIRRLSAEESINKTNKTWYLPMFPVQNPNKPGKTRLVWDFAAKSNGIALNDMLLSGPDLNATLLDILFRFRQGKVAVVGDIKEMFHRVYIAASDQDAQRFLWRRNKEQPEPDEYVINVMTFGATCSPSAAQFVKNKNAHENMNEFPDAYKSIVDNTYVDDWLNSFMTEEEAARVAVQVKETHLRAGFEMRNWKSNSLQVTRALGATTSLTDGLNLDLKNDTNMEKVLGLWWNWKNDTFTYSLRYLKGGQNILQGERVPTKREVLRILMSIYDPLGLLSHFLVYLKILQQDLWRSKIDWDDCISEIQYESFRKWLKLLPLIEKLEIPRCYLDNIDNYHDADIQLHVFCDAGEQAVATAAYFRIKKGEVVSCILIAAKTHVAPLKPTSMPRLELEAAVMAARLGKCIKKAHELKINKSLYWSDSTTVILWIQSHDIRPCGKFVAFRVAEIQENSNPCEWRYVTSEQNPADDGTKWEKMPTMQAGDRWFKGPNFLYENEENWPKKELRKPNDKSFLAIHQEEREKLVDFNRFSTWRKLRKTVAILFFYRSRCKSNKPKIISPEDFMNAENWIFRQVQWEAFHYEVKTLQRKTNSIGKTSLNGGLKNLSPYLDEFGVMRGGGRIDAAIDVPSSMKRPIILPRKHKVTGLIVQHHHERMEHIMQETAINEIRQRYHIPQIRVVANEIREKCPTCKIRNAKPIEPQQAALPAARITPYLAPFTFTGVDFAGPLHVTVKRSTEKRYVVLFTCLVTRAIHTEISHSLDTDSCITAIRTFMLIRGQPREFFSDRGTNFVATEKLLRPEVAKLDTIKIAEHAASDGIKWNFNPPLSPHMGGAWERLIRSLKNALYASVPSRNFTEWSLKAAMAEATYMINMRPLTYVSVKDEYSQPLCPNDFLIGNINGVKPTGEIPNDDSLLRYHYLSTQQFRNRLWKRWIREYLPDLVRRTKGFGPTSPLKCGDIVVICDGELPANSWPKGRVIETYPGSDGQVRSAKVQTINGIYHRPAVKLARLDLE